MLGLWTQRVKGRCLTKHRTRGGGALGGEDKFQLFWTTGTRWQGGVSGLGGGQDPAGTEAGVGGSSGLGVTGPGSSSWAGGRIGWARLRDRQGWSRWRRRRRRQGEGRPYLPARPEPATTKSARAPGGRSDGCGDVGPPGPGLGLGLAGALAAWPGSARRARRPRGCRTSRT